MKQVYSLNSPDSKPPRPPGIKPLLALAVIILAAFGLLLVVGFENVLALFRYRVALFLVVGPLLALFLWCAWKAFGPQKKD